jgi:hypothetical protein
VWVYGEGVMLRGFFEGEGGYGEGAGVGYVLYNRGGALTEREDRKGGERMGTCALHSRVYISLRVRQNPIYSLLI